MKGTLLGLPIAIFVLGLFVYDWPLSRVELALYDRSLRWLCADDTAPEEIALAAIDSGSLQTLGAWPWPRARHAEAIERLVRDGAKAIYLDVGIFDPDRVDPENDRRLVEATTEAGNVIYPMIFEEIEENEQKRTVPLEPLPEISNAASGVAHAHLDFGPDGVVRAAHLAYRTKERTYWGPSVEIVRRYFGLPESAVVPRGSGIVRLGELDIPVAVSSGSSLREENEPRAAYEMNIAFLGGDQSFASTPVAALLEGRFPRGAFDGKIVLYGATATGLESGHPTPLSKVDRMPGIVIQANTIATILSRRFVRKTSLGSVAAVTLLAAVAWGWSRARWPRRCSAWFLLALLFVLVLAHFFLMGAFRLWFSVTPVAAALTLTHIVAVVLEKRRVPA